MEHSHPGQVKKDSETDPLKEDLSILFSLKDDTRWKVLRSLERSRKEGLTFKDIHTLLGMRPTSLAYHLKVLKGLSLIENTFCLVKGRRDFSFYHITDKGADYLCRTEFLHSSKKDLEDQSSGRWSEPSREISIISSKWGPRFLNI